MTAERREATHTYDPALYVLVPREPTPEMCAAGERVIQHEGAHRPGRTFRRIQAAIAAAPPPPAPQTDDARMREALEEIANPISFWRRQLRPDEILDGAMAVHLANDPQTYIDIAKKALAARGAK